MINGMSECGGATPLLYLSFAGIQRRTLAFHHLQNGTQSRAHLLTSKTNVTTKGNAHESLFSGYDVVGVHVTGDLLGCLAGGSPSFVPREELSPTLSGCLGVASHAYRLWACFPAEITLWEIGRFYK